MAAYRLPPWRRCASTHLRDAALALQPLEHEAREVPGEGRRRIEHRARLGHGTVVKDRGRSRARVPEQIVSHDHDRDAGRADVLLGARVDEPEARDVERARQDRRRHVRDERHGAGFRDVGELDAADGLVRRVVQVGRRPGDGRAPRAPAPSCTAMPPRRRRCPRRRNAAPPGSPARTSGQYSRSPAVAPAGARFMRHRRELRRCAALHEQHAIVRREWRAARAGPPRRARRRP